MEVKCDVAAITQTHLQQERDLRYHHRLDLQTCQIEVIFFRDISAEPH